MGTCSIPFASSRKPDQGVVGMSDASVPTECPTCFTLGICNCCDGEGYIADESTIGVIYDYDGPPYYYLDFSAAIYWPCPECDGSGYCPDCKGKS